MGFAEYDQFDGLGLARLVRNGQVSASELCEEAISRAEALNPKLNAIIRPMYDYARKAAKNCRPEAPFCGVPFLLKDVHHALKGHALSSGSALLRDFVPDHDAEIVRRFKGAGLVILGKTNTPEFKLAYTTEPTAVGPTRNPWNPEYSPGGSSGGSAAAVAARIVPLASATDEGGSIRVPASYCGLFGLKPTRGRNPVGPDFDQEWDGMSTSHVITRSVRDSAAMLDAVAGREPGAPYATLPQRPFLDELRVDPLPLRVGFHARPTYGRNIHPECKRAVEIACRLLEGLGHHVDEITPDYDEEDAARNWCIVLIGNEAAQVERLIEIHGRSRVLANIELPNRFLYGVGRRMQAIDFVQAKRAWRRFGMAMDRVLTNYDLILTPTLGEPPVRIGSHMPTKSDERSMRLLASFAGTILLGNKRLADNPVFAEIVRKNMRGQMPFTLVANMTGHPAMSVPMHWTEDNLPCGVQFIGRFGEDANLLKLAFQLEKAQPWDCRRPSMLDAARV